MPTPDRTIRVKCSDHGYKPPNVAYVYRDKEGVWRCVLSSGCPAALSYAGIGGDEMACRFDLDDCRTAEDALMVMERHGRRYLSGPRVGESVYTYEATEVML